MNIPAAYQYTSSHEWVQELENGNWRIGLTDYAQHALGQLVFVNLPKRGTRLLSDNPLAMWNPSKRVSEVYSPVDGEVGGHKRVAFGPAAGH
jgi:glycine cleavage system H protein